MGEVKFQFEAAAHEVDESASKFKNVAVKVTQAKIRADNKLLPQNELTVLESEIKTSVETMPDYVPLHLNCLSDSAGSTFKFKMPNISWRGRKHQITPDSTAHAKRDD